MEISNDMIFIIVIGLIAMAIFCTYNNEGNSKLQEGFGPNVADADISAIRNLNGLANELMKPNGTLTNPGNLNVAGHINIGPDNKFILNSTAHNDNWLRLYDKTGTGYGDRGFAATNMWTEKIWGNPTIAGNLTSGPVTINGQYNINPHLVLKNTVGSWATGDHFTNYRFIKTETHPNAQDGNFKQFNVGPGGVSIGQANTPAYGSNDALYVKGDPIINGNLRIKGKIIFDTGDGKTSEIFGGGGNIVFTKNNNDSTRHGFYMTTARDNN